MRTRNLGKPTPYWTGVIKKAKAREKAGKVPFSPAEVSRAEDSWLTCACGKQDERLRGSGFDEPWDTNLMLLGDDFAITVLAQSPSAAGSVLKEIEKRAFVLLKELERGK